MEEAQICLELYLNYTLDTNTLKQKKESVPDDIWIFVENLSTQFNEKVQFKYLIGILDGRVHSRNYSNLRDKHVKKGCHRHRNRKTKKRDYLLINKLTKSSNNNNTSLVPLGRLHGSDDSSVMI